jgi:hypothetical protein
MKLTHKVLTVGAVMVGLLGSCATAATAATTPPPPPGASTGASHLSVADIKHRIDRHLTKLTDRAVAARRRVDADPSLTAAEKAKLDADLSKLITDATTARRRVDAATNRAGLEAARPALRAVAADRLQVYKDLQAIHARRTPGPTAPPSAVPAPPSPS